MVTEFLHRIKDVFSDYFGSCTVHTIKDNFVVVYELLDEVLDAGFPLVTEPNVLKVLFFVNKNVSLLLSLKLSSKIIFRFILGAHSSHNNFAKHL